MKGIEVRLRDVGEAESKVLCETTFDLLDELISEMKRWGVVRPDGNMDNDLAGQFILDNDSAHFEIIGGS